jgi:hypothetical protein
MHTRFLVPKIFGEESKHVACRPSLLLEHASALVIGSIQFPSPPQHGTCKVDKLSVSSVRLQLHLTCASPGTASRAALVPGTAISSMLSSPWCRALQLPEGPPRWWMRYKSPTAMLFDRISSMAFPSSVWHGEESVWWIPVSPPRKAWSGEESSADSTRAGRCSGE